MDLTNAVSIAAGGGSDPRAGCESAEKRGSGPRIRQFDPEAGAAAGRVGGRHASGVGSDDAVDDGQAEPRARFAAHPAALGAPEALEDVVAVAVGKARAVVADEQQHVVVLAAHRDVDRGSRGRVHDRVAQEVSEYVMEL